MLILDTNVVSEVMRPKPALQVLAWLDAQAPATVYLTAVNWGELQAGIEILPAGRRQRALRAVLQTLRSSYLTNPVLAYDESAAERYAKLLATARANGVSVSAADGQIAAIALVHGFTVASRDTAPFAAAGVATINPWRAV